MTERKLHHKIKFRVFENFPSKEQILYRNDDKFDLKKPMFCFKSKLHGKKTTNEPDIFKFRRNLNARKKGQILPFFQKKN